MRRRGSGIAYLLGMSCATLSTAIWLGRVVWRFETYVEDPDFEIETKLVIFLVVKAVFLGIHGVMVRVDWSTWGFAYYYAFAILYFDLLQVIIGAIFWRQFRKYRRKVTATRQEEQKNNRKEYLKSLPRRNWQDLEPRTPPEEAPVPEESKANIQNERHCRIALSSQCLSRPWRRAPQGRPPRQAWEQIPPWPWLQSWRIRWRR